MPASGERRSIVAMRSVWGILVGLSLILFMLSIPSRYGELADIGRRATAHFGSDDDFLLRFLSQGAYAFTVLSLEIIFVLALTVVSVVMVWRNWDDWRPLFFSATFVTYAVWVTPTLDSLALPPVLQTLADLLQAVGLFMAVCFFLLFYDGHFVPRWTRLSALGWAVYCLAWGLFPGMPLSLIDPFGRRSGHSCCWCCWGGLSGWRRKRCATVGRTPASASGRSGSCSSSPGRVPATPACTCLVCSCLLRARPDSTTSSSVFLCSGCSPCLSPSR